MEGIQLFLHKQNKKMEELRAEVHQKLFKMEIQSEKQKKETKKWKKAYKKISAKAKKMELAAEESAQQAQNWKAEISRLEKGTAMALDSQSTLLSTIRKDFLKKMGDVTKTIEKIAEIKYHCACCNFLLDEQVRDDGVSVLCSECNFLNIVSELGHGNKWVYVKKPETAISGCHHYQQVSAYVNNAGPLRCKTCGNVGIAIDANDCVAKRVVERLKAETTIEDVIEVMNERFNDLASLEMKVASFEAKYKGEYMGFSKRLHDVEEECHLNLNFVTGRTTTMDTQFHQNKKMVDKRLWEMERKNDFLLGALRRDVQHVYWMVNEMEWDEGKKYFECNRCNAELPMTLRPDLCSVTCTECERPNIVTEHRQGFKFVWVETGPKMWCNHFLSIGEDVPFGGLINCAFCNAIGKCQDASNSMAIRKRAIKKETYSKEDLDEKLDWITGRQKDLEQIISEIKKNTMTEEEKAKAIENEISYNLAGIYKL